MIISPATATGITNQSFNYQIVLADFQTGTYSAAGLVPGLTLDTATGVISGAPTEAGTYTVTLTAANVNGTGTATLSLTVRALLPAVALTVDVPVAYPRRNQPGRFTLTRQGGDLSQRLTVVFVVKGSARDGVDYRRIPLSKTIEPGQLTRHIQVVPVALSDAAPDGKKTVKLSLQPSEAYTVQGSPVGKVKIDDTP